MRIRVRVLPRSSKNEVVGELANGVLKIKLTTAPVDGKANAALIDILSEHFGVLKKNIAVLKGEASKDKLIEVLGL